MVPRSWLLILLFGSAEPMLAQAPYLSHAANSASYRRDGLARGSLFVVFGSYLGPGTLQQVSGFPLPAELAGSSITVKVGAVSATAPMVYAWTSQLAAILPSAMPEGEGTLTVSYRGVKSESRPITVVRSAFGTYTVGSDGSGPGIIADPEYRVKSNSAPAKPGDTLIIWGTGLGPVDGNEASGALPGNRFTDVQVYVGSRSALVRYAGRSGCCAGLDQIVFDVPAETQGCFVPVAVRSGGRTSNFVSLPVSTGGGGCTDAAGIPTDLLGRMAEGVPVKVGTVALGPVRILQGAGYSYSQALAERLSVLMQRPIPEAAIARLLRSRGSERDRLLREAMKNYGARGRLSPAKWREALLMAQSFDELGAAAGFSQIAGLSGMSKTFAGFLPPPGACTVVDGETIHLPSKVGRAQDAGSQLTLTGPLGSRLLQKTGEGQYQVSLGSGFSGGQVPAGEYVVSGTGGRDISAFTSRLQATGGPKWLNKMETVVVDRTQPLTVRWSGGVGYVLIGGLSSGSGQGRAFSCVEEASKGTFSVPAFVLSALAAASSPDGYLFISQHPLLNRLTAPGLDLAYFADLSSDGKEIEYR